MLRLVYFSSYKFSVYISSRNFKKVPLLLQAESFFNPVKTEKPARKLFPKSILTAGKPGGIICERSYTSSKRTTLIFIRNCFIPFRPGRTCKFPSKFLSIFPRNYPEENTVKAQPVKTADRRGPGYANTAAFWALKKWVNFFSSSQPLP